MRIPSGTTDQYIYFVAVDATDLTTRETGLSGFTVYRSRNGGAAASFTTPTVNETDATNMPGVYELLLDEDMTIDAGDDSQEMVFHITHASMAPVTRVIELYRPKITAGETLTVSSGTGNAAVQSVANNALTAAALASDAVNEIVDQVWREATADHSGTASSFANLIQYMADLMYNTNEVLAPAILEDTGTTIPALIAAIDGSTFTTIPWNASWDAEVQSEVTDALNAYDPPTNAEMEARTLAAADYATATALATVDTVADAVKVKTDSLTFTVAGQIDANIKSVAGTTVTGTGSEADPWGP